MRNLLNLLIFMDMRYIYYLFSLCLGLSLLACGDDADDPAEIPVAGDTASDQVDIAFVDEEGNCLISSGALNIEDLRLSYLWADGEYHPGYGSEMALVKQSDSGYANLPDPDVTYLAVRIKPEYCEMPPYFSILNYTATENLTDKGAFRLEYGEWASGPIDFTVCVRKNEYNSNRYLSKIVYDGQTFVDVETNVDGPVVIVMPTGGTE